MKTLTAAQDDYRLRVHELAHHLTASSYGIGSSPKVFAAEARPKQADGQTLGGICRLAGTGSKFEAAVIGWSGVVGELIAGASAFDVCFKLEKATARAWFYIALADLAELSYSDRAMIVGYRHYWRSFKRAFEILNKEKRTLLRLAKAPKTAPKVVAPPPPPEQEPAPHLPANLLPAAFPASNMDFIRLIIEPRGRTESFNKFSAAAPPPDLKDRDAWEKLALDFYRWECGNP